MGNYFALQKAVSKYFKPRIVVSEYSELFDCLLILSDVQTRVTHEFEKSVIFEKSSDKSCEAQ